MFSRLPFLIPFIAITEIFLIIKVGGAIGFWPTVGIVLLTGMTGVTLLRHQGFQLIVQLNNRLSQGQMPASEMMEGVALLVGGVMLITPGFITDICGFCLLLPWSRKWLISRISGVWERQIQSGGRATFYQARGTTYGHSGFDSQFDRNSEPENQTTSGDREVYEGEYTRVDRPDSDNSEKK